MGPTLNYEAREGTAMEYDQTTSLAIVGGLFAVIAIATVMSPMGSLLKAAIVVGLLALVAVTMFVGVQHGEYRAAS